MIRAQVLSYEFWENTVLTEHIWVTASVAKCFMFWWNCSKYSKSGKMLDLTFEPQLDFFEALAFLWSLNCSQAFMGTRTVPWRTFPRRTFSLRTVPRIHFLTDSFSMKSSPKESSANGQLPERIFLRRAVSRMAFPQTDISTNHIFFILIFIVDIQK